MKTMVYGRKAVAGVRRGGGSEKAGDSHSCHSPPLSHLLLFHRKYNISASYIEREEEKEKILCMSLEGMSLYSFSNSENVMKEGRREAEKAMLTPIRKLYSRREK